MNCNECLNLLNDYVEDALAAKFFVPLETHLAACERCAHGYQKLKKEQNLYEQYLSNIEAKPELWTSLEAKLEKAQNRNYWHPLAYLQNLFANNYRGLNLNSLRMAAFFIIAAIGITGFIGYKFSSNSSEQNYAVLQENPSCVSQASEIEAVKPHNDPADDLKDKQPVIAKKIQPATQENNSRKSDLPVVSSKRANQVAVSKISNATRRQPNEEVVRKVEQQYMNAVAILTRDIERRRKELSFGSLSQAETVLTDLDRTIENTRRAVREQPQNPVAVQYMTDAYAKKIELLRNVLIK